MRKFRNRMPPWRNNSGSRKDLWETAHEVRSTSSTAGKTTNGSVDPEASVSVRTRLSRRSVLALRRPETLKLESTSVFITTRSFLLFILLGCAAPDNLQCFELRISSPALASNHCPLLKVAELSEQRGYCLLRYRGGQAHCLGKGPQHCLNGGRQKQISAVNANQLQCVFSGTSKQVQVEPRLHQAGVQALDLEARNREFLFLPGLHVEHHLE